MGPESFEENMLNQNYHSQDFENSGIIPRALVEIFRDSRKKPGDQIFKCCYLELYNEEFFNLLQRNSDKLKLRECPDYGITTVPSPYIDVNTIEEAFEALMTGISNRKVASTDLNQRSSRSHTIFQIIYKEQDLNGNITFSQLNFVDLVLDINHLGRK